MPEKTAEEKAAEVKLTDDISKAGSSDEIRDLVTRPRDEHGRFTSAAPVVESPKLEEKKDPEPTVFKDTFLVGGKQMEFTGENEGDILRQVKAAQQAWEMAQPKPEVKKEPPKEPFTKEELAALSLKVAQGDLSAIEEFVAKSGVVDKILEARGFKPEEYKAVLEERASTKVKDEWSGAINEFLTDPTCKWPGGTQNEKLLKYKLAELKDADGVALAHKPSKASLDRAFAALQEEGLLFPVEEQKVETKSAAEPAKKTEATTTTVAKKAASSSTAFVDSGNRTRAANEKPKVPEITPEMSGEEIMAAFKAAAIAAGQSPDDVLRGSYSGKVQ